MSQIKQHNDAVSYVLLLNKPIGISSSRAVQRVKRHLHLKKVGHAGTLDPLAEGLLIVASGKATRALTDLVALPKCYQVAVRLGMRTTTGDREGEVIERRHFTPPDRQTLQDLATAFSGELRQIPPMYSALKHQGQRLYKLARANCSVARAERTIWIDFIKIRTISDNGFCFEVQCSKGTYIRTLVEDMAVWLGTVAHTAALRRTAIGSFRLSNAVALSELDDSVRFARARLAVDQIYGTYPAQTIDSQAEYRFKHGQQLTEVLAPQGTFRLYNQVGQFLAISEAGSIRTRFV